MYIDHFREYCLTFPFTNEGLPFGPDTLVFKVHGKMFALISLNDEPYRVNLKCDPEAALNLRVQFPEAVFPGYHMNKKHWNTIIPEHESLTLDLVKQWVTDSYDLVFASLPKKLRNPSV